MLIFYYSIRAVSLLFVLSEVIVCGVFFFFFQAEDGIRYLVRSRGLGDVYKRQGLGFGGKLGVVVARRADVDQRQAKFADHFVVIGTVSYTHLTLPTSDLV